MSKRVYFFGLAIVAVALAFVLAEQLFWEPGVSASNVRRIRRGMNLAEVEAILGGRSDTDLEAAARSARLRWLVEEVRKRIEEEIQGEPFLSHGVLVSGQVVELEYDSSSGTSRTSRVWWKGDRGTATVQFDENDKVESARFESSAQTGFLDSLRSLLGW